MDADLVSRVAARAAPERGDLCAATRMAAWSVGVRLCRIADMTASHSYPLIRISGGP